jgi:MinD-like ATPase involved in chromosome partitioning or flagellar assembly
MMGVVGLKGRVVAFHSSRGGTGKTTVAANLALAYAREGLKVVLLDLDFRAPSLFSVFSKGIRRPVKRWLNDFVHDRCSLEQALVDVSEEYGVDGKLFVGLANPSLEAIRNMMGRSRSWEVGVAKRLFSIRGSLFGDVGVDCCILDTSPGIQYSSINGVVSSDVAVVVTTLDSVDVEGVKGMLTEFYDEFEKKSVILMNKVFPQTRIWSDDKRSELVNRMEKFFCRPVVGVIPCYCDVLESKRASLLVVENPGHPFLEDLKEVMKKLECV